MPTNQESNTGRDHGSFRISISNEDFNFTTYDVRDPQITGAQIAEIVEAHPVTDFVILQHLRSGELETLRPTETANVEEKGVEHFFVIQGSETFRFVVDGLSMEWPRESILGKQIKFLARVNGSSVLIWDRANGNQVVEDNDKVSLGGAGVEEFKTRKLVTVIYNHDQRFELEPRVYTTEELIDIFKVPAGYKLDLVPKDAPFHELVPGEKIHISEGMEFASHPPRGQSS